MIGMRPPKLRKVQPHSGLSSQPEQQGYRNCDAKDDGRPGSISKLMKTLLPNSDMLTFKCSPRRGKCPQRGINRAAAESYPMPVHF